MKALILALVFVAGCATAGTPKDATLAQKLKADAVAFEQVCNDVGQKCGANLLSFVKTVNDAIAAATDYTDLIAEVVHAAAIYQDVKMDISSVECVIATVRQDLKNMAPKKAAMLDRAIAELSARQSFAEVDMCDVRPDRDVGACRPLVIDCGDNKNDCEYERTIAGRAVDLDAPPFAGESR